MPGKGVIISSFLFLFLLSITAKGQNSQTYEWFDEVVGPSNTGLFNGVGYIEAHRMIDDNHKFFLANEFIPGVLIYDGQPYYSQPLKYNVFDGVLLIQTRDGMNESLFQLINDKIDGFEIQGHQFTNVKPGVDSNVQGFYEVLFQNEKMQLLKKHSRRIIQHNNRQFFHYEFKPQENDYQLKYNNEFHEIGSRRDLINAFPEFKKEIREFYASERGLRNSNPDRFMINLLNELSSMIKTENKTGA